MPELEELKVKPLPKEWEKSKKWWEQESRRFAQQGAAPFKSRGVTPIAEIPKGKSFWGTLRNQLLGRLFSGGIVKDPTTGKAIGVTEAQFPETVMEEQRTQAQTILDNSIRAQFFMDMYSRLRILTVTGKVNSYEDYLVVTGESGKYLTPDDIKEARQAIAGRIQERDETPDWLEIDPEDAEAVRAFLEEPARKVAPNTIQKATIDAIVQSLARPVAKLPKDMTGEELLSLAAVMDLPPESVSAALDIDMAVKLIREATLEKEQMMADVKAGIAEWKIPDSTLGERILFAVQSPMQQFADLMQPYLENYAYPMAGMIMQGIAKASFWREFEIERTFRERRAAGVDTWHSFGESWEEYDLPMWLKLPMEIVFDPISYIPGWGFSKTGLALVRLGKTAPGKMLKLGAFGDKLIAFNKGLWEMLDFPFDAAKFSLKHMPTTTKQLAQRQSDELINHFYAAAYRQTGKIAERLTVEDAIKTLRDAKAAHLADPQLDGDVLVELGRILTKQAPMTEKEIGIWSRSYGGKLLSDMADAGIPIIPKVGTKFDWGMVEFHKSIIPEIRTRLDDLVSRLPADVRPVINRIMINPKMQYGGRWIESERILQLSTKFTDGDFYHEIAHAVHPNLDEKAVEAFGRQLEQSARIRPPAPVEPLPIVAPMVSEVNQIIQDFMNKVGNPAANAKRMARALGIEETPDNLTKLIKEIPAFNKKKGMDIDVVAGIGKNAQIEPVARMLHYMVGKRKAIVELTQVGKEASGSFLEGLTLAMIRKVDKIENWRWRVTLDRFFVKPLAEANLGSISYPIWNAFESIAVSLIEGVTPRLSRFEAFTKMTAGLLNDPALIGKTASDIAGMFGSISGRRAGAVTLLPSYKIPPRLKGWDVPSWLAGKDPLAWTGRRWIEMSDYIGNAYRRNFVVEKMSRYLAERALNVSGVDINLAFKNIIKGSPKLSRTITGLTRHELEQEMFRRLTVSTGEVLALKELLTDGSLLQGEMLKILRKADYLSPRAKAIGEQLIHEGKVFKGVAPDIDAGAIYYHGSPVKDLDIIKASDGDWGRGVYFTTSEKGAVEYSKGRVNIRKFVLGDTDVEPTIGTVYRIGAKPKKPLVISTVDDYNKYLDEGERLFGENTERNMAKWARKEGYDGIINNVNQEGIMFVDSVPVIKQAIPDNGILDFVRQTSQAAIDDLKQYPIEVGKSFRQTANTIDATPINTRAELMEIFTHYETMSETAAYIPHRLMSQAMGDADLLYKERKFGQVDTMWRKARQDLMDTMVDINSSLETVKAKLLANADKLTIKQRTAMEAVLERSSASNAVRDAVLAQDGQLLDDFFSLPKALRTPDEYTALRNYRNEIWTNYRNESAIPSAGEFVTRANLAKLYHNLPEPKLNPVNAESRALSIKDVTDVFGVNIDGLSAGLLDNISLHGKPYFIQLVKQTADSRPSLFKGFTEEKIGLVYDDILRSAKMNPEMDIATQKILMQVEGMKQELIGLKMRHALSPDDEKALHAWIDKVAEGRKGIIGDASAPILGKFKWSQEWQKRQVANDVESFVKGNPNLWYHGRFKLEGNILEEGNFITKDLDEAMDYAMGVSKTGELGEAFVYVVDVSKAKIGPGGIAEGTAELLAPVRILKRFDINKVYPEPKVLTGKPLVSDVEWQKIRQLSLDDALKDYYKVFADYTNQNIIGAVMKMIYPYWCVPEYATILTRTGWKEYPELVIGEDVLVVDPKTLVTRWEPIQDMAEFDYDGDLMVIPAKGKDIEFTPNHRWLTIRKYDSPSYPSIKLGSELIDQIDMIPRALPHNFPTNSALTPRDAAILGWLVTDGTIRKYSSMIYQSYEKYLFEIEKLVGTKAKYCRDKTYYVHVPQEDMKRIKASCPDKEHLSETITRLSKLAAEAMWDAMFKAEGNNYQGNQSWYQNPGLVMESFQLLSVLLGKAVTVNRNRVNILNNAKPYNAKEARRMFTRHYKGKVWCPVTPSGTWFMNCNGSIVPTGNSYQAYRWFYLSRAALRHPGLPAAWGKYQDYGEYGYQPTFLPNIEMNPFVGSIIGTTFALTRTDFSSYYQSLGYAGEMLDHTQRLGFYPGAHIQLPISLTSYFTGRPIELGEILPPGGKTVLNLLSASKVPGAITLKDKVFHENFHQYYTATLVSNKQVEAGGTLISGQSGTDLWFKILRKEKLSEEEQALWDEAYREASLIGVLRAQFPQFRLKTEEYNEAYDTVTKVIEEQLGMSEEFQKDLWRNHLRPTDVVGGLPLDTRMALDQLWQWREFLGRGAILNPPEVSDLKALIDKYYKKVKSYQEDRLSTQGDLDKGFMSPTKELHYTGKEWRQEYAANWSDYTSKVDETKTNPEFADAIEALTPEGQLAMAKRLGFTAPPTYPLDEAIDIYFEIKLEKKADPFTGEEEDDFLTFWLKREAVRMALTEDQRLQFDMYIRRYTTPMEGTFRHVYNRYIRGYRAVDRIMFEGYGEEQKSLISEYYATTATLARKEEIGEVISLTGRKLVAEYDAKRGEARQALRDVSPTLDFYLYAFGYVTTVRTPEARTLVDAWESDRSTILIPGVEGISYEPKPGR